MAFFLRFSQHIIKPKILYHPPEKKKKKKKQYPNSKNKQQQKTWHCVLIYCKKT